MAHTPSNGSRYPGSDDSEVYSPQLNPIAPVETTPRKRKHGTQEEDAAQGKRQKTQTPIDRSRLRSSPEIAGLPCEIWQHTFSFLPPRSLPPLLWTCRSFNQFLTDSSLENCKPQARGLRIVHPSQVWKASRTGWFPAIPHAPPGVDELDLFRLLGRTDCQFCHREGVNNSGPDPWTSGPGQDGVRIVWPFTVRSCGPCLAQRTQSHQALMLSDFSGLSSHVSFVFFTKDQHVLSPSAFRSAKIPQNVDFSKVFLLSQLEDVQNRLFHAREKSSSDAMSLLSVLGNEQPALFDLYEAWENWENQGPGLVAFRSQAGTEEAADRPTSRGAQFTSIKLEDNDEQQSSASDFLRPSTARPGHSRGNSAPHRPPTRTKAGAEEAKAIRRSEIERRCNALDPPITSQLLEYMDSFKAAMQISMPMTDEAWEMLRPKLLAQRQAAQHRLDEQNAATDALAQNTNTSDVMSDADDIRERWETFQRPIRSALCNYVDVLIHTSWAGGSAINAQTAPRFAADALVFARNRYAADKPQNMQSGSAFQLVLHNMKWLYENKVKPLAEDEHDVRDLFRCSGCPADSKLFPFDSLIQHYAAKHTSAFSSKKTGIAWYEAAWPEDPPFQTQDFLSPTSSARVDLAQPSTDYQHSTFPMQTHTDAYTLYQPRAAIPRPPLSSPGFPPEGYAIHGPYHTPVPQHPSQATSPAWSVGPGYPPPPPGHPFYSGATSPFEGHDPRYGMYGVHTPVTAAGGPGGWAGSPGTVPPPHPSFAPSPAQDPRPFMQQQMDEVAGITREIWDILSPVKQLPPYVRVYVLIQHAVTRFKERFSNEPNVDLYARCVGEHPLMQPIRDISGLACKVCVLEKHNPEQVHSHARKLYSFNSLLWHFKQVHIEAKLAMNNAASHDDPEDVKRYDFKEDMVELPPDAQIAGFKHLAGMTEARRLKIFKDVFPHLFEDVTPEPESQNGQEASPSYRASWPMPGQMSPPTSQQTMDPLATQGFIEIGPGDPYAGPYTYTAAASTRQDEYDPSRPTGRWRGARRGSLRGYRGSRGGYYHQVDPSRQHAARQASQGSAPEDLLRSLRTPQGQAQAGEYSPPHQMGPPRYPRYDYFPPPPPQHYGQHYAQHPQFQTAYHAQGQAQGQAQGGWPAAPPSYSPDEEVEYVYVRRNEQGQYQA